MPRNAACAQPVATGQVCSFQQRRGC
jgi:hypothetical protein